jgi:hypothetical protein
MAHQLSGKLSLPFLTDINSSNLVNHAHMTNGIRLTRNTSTSYRGVKMGEAVFIMDPVLPFNK